MRLTVVVGVDAMRQVFKVVVSEVPAERPGDGVVPSLERGEALADLVQADEVVGCEGFALELSTIQNTRFALAYGSLVMTCSTSREVLDPHGAGLARGQGGGQRQRAWMEVFIIRAHPATPGKLGKVRGRFTCLERSR